MMTVHTKTLTSLAAMLLLGLSVTCDASANSSRDDRRTQYEVQSCVAEIAKRANYEGASRIVHRVQELRQKNLVEVEMTIATSVHLDEATGATREYSTSCVIAQLGRVVEIQFAPSAAVHTVAASR